MDTTYLSVLDQLCDEHDESLTHFMVNTSISQSRISGRTRISEQVIESGTLVAVVGGIIVNQADHMLAMPIGFGLFLHQINDARKATVNHSCDPNCAIRGFNRLVAIKEISVGEELTIDYGSVSIGNGRVLIDDCQCGSPQCRHVIKSDDWLSIPIDRLCLYGVHRRSK